MNYIEIVQSHPIFQTFVKGGPVMVPLLALSILSLATIVERMFFWIRIFTKEQEIVTRVLEAARYDWGVANEIARQAYRQPIGRFLYAPLRLQKPDPELFRLALEAAADEELTGMRRGDKMLEAAIALSPLLGLLGTVLGLIGALDEIDIGAVAGSGAKEVTLNISEALISTAAGMIVAITSLAFYRMFQGFLFNQVKVFRKAGNDLELLYRQFWPQVKDNDNGYLVDSPPATRSPEVPKERWGLNKESLKPTAPKEEPKHLEEDRGSESEAPGSV